MSDIASAARSPAPRRVPLLLVSAGVNLAVLAMLVAPIVVIDWARFSAAWSSARFPDVATLAAAPPVILAHLIAVVAALLLTVALLIGRKGTALHRALGWTWSGLLGIGALTGLFIHQAGGWSVFHAYSVLALILLPLGLLAARAHAALMTYLAVNVLLGTAFFATYPGFGERLLVRAIFP